MTRLTHKVTQQVCDVNDPDGFLAAIQDPEMWEGEGNEHSQETGAQAQVEGTPSAATGGSETSEGGESTGEVGTEIVGPLPDPASVGTQDDTPGFSLAV